MRCRDHIALTLPTFLLRLVLAITFLWAGTSKIVGTTTVQDENAARLANIGAPFIQHTSTDLPSTPPSDPSSPLPDSDQTNDPTPPPQSNTKPQTPPTEESSNPEPEPQHQLPIDPETKPDSNPETNPVATLPIIQPVSQSSAPAVATDFPEPVTIKNLYKISLLLDHSVSPSLTDDSQPITPTMPQWLGSGPLLIYAAWAAAITEIVAALLLLLGLLTRVSALSLTTVMLVAIWTTNIGPAALQSSDAILGLIPNTQDPWNPASYQTLLWQLALITMSLSVLLLGPGPLSLDRLFFRPNRRDPYVSGESNTQKLKPAPPEPQRDRTEFDRSPPPPPPETNPTP